MEKKITKAMLFSAIATAIDTDLLPENISADMVKDFCAHEMELLAKRSNADHTKPTAKQTANESIKQDLLSAMASIGEPETAGNIMTAVNETKGTEYSVQKINALLAQLVKSGEVIRSEVKRKAYFAVA